MDDDDDLFLYGDSADTEEPPSSAPVAPAPVPQPQPISLEQVEAFATSNGVVAHLEAEAAGEANGIDEDAEENGADEEEEAEKEDGGEEEEEDSEDDVEIIMEAPSRSLDFRQRPQPGRPSGSFSTPTRPQQAPAPTLTTEYTPRERGSATKPPILQSTPGPSQSTPTPTTPAPPSASQEQQKPSDGVDPNTLPPAVAPPSHPQIDPEAPGTFNGQSILEVDLNALSDKAWRRPGSDISDWFNYGFDEISWEAYCHRRKEMGDTANMLKAAVLNFAGMPEEQINSLPPEIRTMVIASASAMMGPGANAPGGAGMMPGGMNMNGAMMNPMMNMGPMMGGMMDMPVDMGMGGQGMNMGMGPGMGGEGMGGGAMGGPGMGGQGMGGQGMGGQGMPGQGMPGQGMGGPGMGGPTMNGGALSGGVAMSSGGQGQMQGRATPDMQMGMGGGEGFNGGAPGQGGQMPMGGEFGIQGGDMSQQMSQQMYPGSDGAAGAPTTGSTPTRGGTPGHFRGRGIPQQVPLRGARGGGYAARGRPLPVRPASPLPPNVPTGPRNKNKYKDIDGSAPAVEGLDYGGGKDRTTPPDYDDRNSARKRRSSPGLDDRSSKRR
ncbi:uncharacterized protein PHACADRAFT_248228 [Phanerochaete carnosa HHB-10118-sp]|uniref:Pre-mRNA polyadenylation factor Fip1 domain-containing protein n=1 Tax=Phanerochaete carnosa (strain HHB-10118-sp) TaxID=650164 RepID=K5XEN7_PHACS|nr:uncharacterized protein PHACADRAFT_248228 [Phanerochaete carnosa HHB-10118-sp]EKM61547.1 hypothetical protein PHACADRAFT_248228 [Phanerochaete carnosa HHB-10118-sp]